MINTWKKSFLSLLSVSQPHIMKMTYHRHTRLKQIDRWKHSYIQYFKKSDYKTFFCPHVFCPPFFLFEFAGSHLGDEPTASLIVHGCPQRVSMWVCGHAAGRMSVCDSCCWVGGDGVCLHVRVWEEWSLLPTEFSNRTGRNKSTIFLRWGTFEVMTFFEPELSVSFCEHFSPSSFSNGFVVVSIIKTTFLKVCLWVESSLFFCRKTCHPIENSINSI